MVYLYIFLGLVAALLAYMRFEAGFAEVRTVRFTKRKDTLKVMQLSDIHINHLKVPVKRVRKAIDSQKPDIIVISGDYIDSPEDIPDFLEFMDGIICGIPIYLCLGNHDYEAFGNDAEKVEGFIRTLEGKGAVVLHDRSVCISKGNVKYNLIGISDYRRGSHDIGKALSGLESDAAANIGLSHNPDIVLELPKGKVDFLLTGHFHGGQIWAPFDLEFRMLRNEKLCKMGIKRGLHKINGVNLYINRGLGSVCFPLRFMSRPEITVFYMP